MLPETLEQKTKHEPIDSPLLYTTNDGTQGFVHDTYADFFTVRWLSQDPARAEKYWENTIETIHKIMDDNIADNSDKLTEEKEAMFEMSVIGAMSGSAIVQMYPELDGDMDYLINCGITAKEAIESDHIRAVVNNILALMITSARRDTFRETTYRYLKSATKDPNWSKYYQDRDICVMLSKERDPVSMFWGIYGCWEEAYYQLGTLYLNVAERDFAESCKKEEASREQGLKEYYKTEGLTAYFVCTGYLDAAEKNFDNGIDFNRFYRKNPRERMKTVKLKDKYDKKIAKAIKTLGIEKKEIKSSLDIAIMIAFMTGLHIDTHRIGLRYLQE